MELIFQSCSNFPLLIVRLKHFLSQRHQSPGGCTHLLIEQILAFIWHYYDIIIIAYISRREPKFYSQSKYHAHNFVAHTYNLHAKLK